MAESTDALRVLLQEAAVDADNAFTEHPRRVDLAEMGRERQLFVDYVDDLSIDGLPCEPLPYVRTLGREEAEALRSDLQRRWGFDGGWWPPPRIPTEEPVLVVQADWFDHAVPVERLRQVLAQRGWDTILEFREFAENLSRDSELALSEFEPTYTGDGEGLWTTPSLEWVLYASHESSIAVGGDWLVSEIQNLWPEWRQHLYDGWEYKRPPRDADAVEDA